MIRRRHGRSLKRVAAMGMEEDVNPNSYITNIADCMLVLMLGFMIALISYFNIEFQQEEQTDDIVGIEVNLDADADGSIDDGYEHRGSVYYDSASGKYYLVQE